MNDDYDYGGWIIEDLKEQYLYLKKEKERSELYSDRAQLNKMMKNILNEIESRERN